MVDRIGGERVFTIPQNRNWCLCYNTRRMRFMGEIRAAFRIGLAAARANLVPIVVLWTLAALLATGYFYIPEVAMLLEPLKIWQVNHGWVAAFISNGFFCGVIPYIVYVVRRTKDPHGPLLTAMLQAVWCGLSGVAANWFFSALSLWIGHGCDFKTLAIKTIIDQFVWTVIIIAPANAIFYATLAGRRCNWRTKKPLCSFIRTDYLPNLIVNWFIWIPVVFMVFSFPLALQIQILGLIGASWVIICHEIGSRRK